MDKEQVRTVLINQAAFLLMNKFSECADDYPKTFQKYILRDFEAHNEKLRCIAVRLRLLADELKSGD